MTELHEHEQHIQDKIPTTLDGKDHVSVERLIGEHPNTRLPMVSENKQFTPPFDTANARIHRGRHELEGLLLPFHLRTKRRGKVKINSNARFYFEDHEIHIKMQEISVDFYGQIFMRFRETGCTYPSRSWTFRTGDLARYIEAERLLSDKEIDENAREALEGLQAQS